MNEHCGIMQKNDCTMKSGGMKRGVRNRVYEPNQNVKISHWYVKSQR